MPFNEALLLWRSKIELAGSYTKSIYQIELAGNALGYLWWREKSILSGSLAFVLARP
jgi:hypothetical protein